MYLHVPLYTYIWIYIYICMYKYGMHKRVHQKGSFLGVCNMISFYCGSVLEPTLNSLPSEFGNVRTIRQAKAQKTYKHEEQVSAPLYTRTLLTRPALLHRIPAHPWRCSVPRPCFGIPSTSRDTVILLGASGKLSEHPKLEFSQPHKLPTVTYPSP